MIEIKCTKQQKTKIIEALSCFCLFTFCPMSPDIDCKKCVEKNIKWEITNEK